MVFNIFNHFNNDHQRFLPSIPDNSINLPLPANFFNFNLPPDEKSAICEALMCGAYFEERFPNIKDNPFFRSSYDLIYKYKHYNYLLDIWKAHLSEAHSSFKYVPKEDWPKLIEMLKMHPKFTIIFYSVFTRSINNFRKLVSYFIENQSLRLLDDFLHMCNEEQIDIVYYELVKKFAFKEEHKRIQLSLMNIFFMNKGKKDIFIVIDEYKKNPIQTVFNEVRTELHQEYMQQGEAFIQEIVSIFNATDRKLLASLLGDYFIKESALIGGHYFTHLKSILDFINNSKKTGYLKNVKADTILESLLEMQSWAVKYPLTENYIAILGTELSQNLKNKGSLHLFGGWQGDAPAGHAMIYKFYKLSHGKYQVDIYNTGAGLQYHNSILMNGKQKKFPVFSITNIKESKLSAEFFCYLAGFTIILPMSVTKRFDEDDIYQFFIRNLGGKIINYENFEKNKGISPQISGTCSLKILFSFLRFNMPFKEYIPFKFYFNLVHLSLFSQKLKNESSKSDEILFHYCCKNFARLAAKYYAANLITGDELELAYSCLVNFNKKWNKVPAEKYSEINVVEEVKPLGIKSFFKKKISYDELIKNIDLKLENKTSKVVPHFDFAAEPNQLLQYINMHIQIIKSFTNKEDFCEQINFCIKHLPSLGRKPDFSDSIWLKATNTDRLSYAVYNLFQLYNQSKTFHLVDRYYLLAVQFILTRKILNSIAKCDVFENIFFCNSSDLRMYLYNQQQFILDDSDRKEKFLDLVYLLGTKKNCTYELSMKINEPVVVFSYSVGVDPKKIILDRYLDGVGRIERVKLENPQYYLNDFQKIFTYKSKLMDGSYYVFWKQWVETFVIEIKPESQLSFVMCDNSLSEKEFYLYINGTPVAIQQSLMNIIFNHLKAIDKLRSVDSLKNTYQLEENDAQQLSEILKNDNKLLLPELLVFFEKRDYLYRNYAFLELLFLRFVQLNKNIPYTDPKTFIEEELIGNHSEDFVNQLNRLIGNCFEKNKNNINIINRIINFLVIKDDIIKNLTNKGYEIPRVDYKINYEDLILLVENEIKSKKTNRERSKLCFNILKAIVLILINQARVNKDSNSKNLAANFLFTTLFFCSYHFPFTKSHQFIIDLLPEVEENLLCDKSFIEKVILQYNRFSCFQLPEKILHTDKLAIQFGDNLRFDLTTNTFEDSKKALIKAESNELEEIAISYGFTLPPEIKFLSTNVGLMKSACNNYEIEAETGVIMVSKDVLMEKLKTKLPKYEFFDKELRAGKYVNVIPYSKQNSNYPEYLKKIERDFYISAVPPYFKMEKFQRWYSVDCKENHLILISNDSNLCYKLLLRNKEILIFGFFDTKLQLGKNEGSRLLKPLHRIEDSAHIQIWMNPIKCNIEKISLYRTKYLFTVKQNNNISQIYYGNSVLQTNKANSIANMPNALVFINETTGVETIIFSPYSCTNNTCSDSPLKDNSLGPSLKLRNDPSAVSFFPLFELHNSKRALFSNQVSGLTTTESQFHFFVKNLLIASQFDAAFTYIKKLYKFTYSEGSKIPNFIFLDAHPVARHGDFHALQLHMLLLNIERKKYNDPNFSLDLISVSSEIIKIIKDYISKLSHITNKFKLTQSQLKTIIDNLPSLLEDDIIKNFYNSLSQSEIKILSAKFPVIKKVINFNSDHIKISNYPFNKLSYHTNLLDVYKPDTLKKDFLALFHQILLIKSELSVPEEAKKQLNLLSYRINFYKDDGNLSFLYFLRKAIKQDISIRMYDNISYTDLLKVLDIYIAAIKANLKEAPTSTTLEEHAITTASSQAVIAQIAKVNKSKHFCIKSLEELDLFLSNTGKSSRMQKRSKTSFIKNTFLEAIGNEFVVFKNFVLGHIFSDDEKMLSPEFPLKPFMDQASSSLVKHMCGSLEEGYKLILEDTSPRSFRFLGDRNILQEEIIKFFTIAWARKNSFFYQIKEKYSALNQYDSTHYIFKLLDSYVLGNLELNPNNLAKWFSFYGHQLKNEQPDLYNSMYCYLLITAIVHKVIEVERAVIQNQPKAAYDLLINELPELVDDQEIDPLFNVSLGYQYLSNKILKKTQQNFLKKVDSAKKIVMQIGCGEGKTKILTILAAFNELRKNQLVINIVPKSNIVTNYNDLAEQAEKFNILIKRLEFNRQTSLSNNYQMRVLQDLNRAIENKEIIILEPQTIQNLMLRYIESVNDLVKGKKDETFDFDSFEEILSLLVNASAIVDEAHLAYKTLSLLTYGLSEKQSNINLYRCNYSILLFKIMVWYNYQPGKPCYFPINEKRNELFTMEGYRKTLLPFLAERAYVAMVSNEDKEENKTLIIDYLTIPKNEITNDKRAQLKEWLGKQTPDQAKSLMLLRAQLQIYLPYTLSQRCNVKYGRSQKMEQAVPYIGNNTVNENSNFENADILINFSVLLHLQEGLTVQQVKNLMYEWKKQHISQKTIDHVGKTKAQLEFAAFYPRKDLEDIDLYDKNTLIEVHSTIYKNQNVIFQYLSKYLFLNVELENYKISSNAQDLGETFFKKIISFTGTPNNHITYPISLECRLDLASGGELLAIFGDNNNYKMNFFEDALDLENQLNTGNIENLSMILDPAAYYEGRSNYAVASSLRSVFGEKFKEFCYFLDNKQSELHCLRDGLVYKFTENSCLPSERLYYCDEQHTTGTDLEIPSNGVAILLIEKNLTLTKFFQSAKRLRKLGHGQKLELFIPNRVRKEIELKTGGITIHHIIFWALQNEEVELKKSLAPAPLHQVQNVYKKRALYLLIETYKKKISAKEKCNLRKEILTKYNDLFIEPVNREEFIEHASIDLPEDKMVVLKRRADEYKAKYPDLLIEEDTILLENIFARADKFADLDFDDGLDLTSEKEHEAYHENEQNLQVCRNTAIEPRWNCLMLQQTCFFDFIMSELSKCWIEINHGTQVMCLYSVNKFFQAFQSDIAQEIFFSESFYKYEDIAPVNIDISKFPRIQYVLKVSKENKAFYLILSKTEADIVRPWLLSQTKEFICTFPIQYELYQSNGQLIGALHKPQRKREHDNALVQIKFLNNEVEYSQKDLDYLEVWLKEDMEKKMIFFTTLQRKRATNKEINPHFMSTTLHKLFLKLKDQRKGAL